MKYIAKLLVTAVFALAFICSLHAATEMKDGFTVKDNQVLITVNGATKVMANDMKLHNGILVRTRGEVVVPGGIRTTLKEGDTMTFGGVVTRASTGKTEELKPSE